jgi:hypothetical protein
MKQRLRISILRATLILLFSLAARPDDRTPAIPKAWDDATFAGWHVPLAAPGAEPVPLTADQFYRLPELKIYRSYPVYAPGKEPDGYLERLGQAEPELVFDPAKFRNEADWVRAGGLVFDAPVTISAIGAQAYITDAAWYRDHNVPIAKDGTVPFYRYVVRKKGKVEIGSLSCSNCHTRVLPDGSVVKGAQGNFPRSLAVAYFLRKLIPSLGEAVVWGALRSIYTRDYSTPWLKDDLDNRFNDMTLDDSLIAGESLPAGVTACHNSSLFSPVQVPDLIGIKERKYLDHTGQILHRKIDDLMRFEAFIQGNTLVGFGDYKLPALGPELTLQERMSDAQLYALALYLYSLRPPRNPNRTSALSTSGAQIFKREGCERCDAPPLFTNNTVTIALGFNQPAKHVTK